MTDSQAVTIRVQDAVAAIKANVQMVKHIQAEIMKIGTHYGPIPGTDKPTLLQPGAETIALAFHWSAKYEVEDLSYTDVVRYRVTCNLYNRDSGEFVGSGQGEASSDEEKYRWRKAICQEEFDAASVDRRRVKWARGKGGTNYTINQIRQEPADIANTVLKMSSKRAFIAAIRTASGCSDMFAQDLEDLPREVREAVVEAEEPVGQPIGPKDWKTLVKAALLQGYTEEDVVATAKTLGHEGTGPELPEAIAQRIYQSMKSNPKPERSEEPTEPRGFHTPLMSDE